MDVDSTPTGGTACVLLSEESAVGAAALHAATEIAHTAVKK